MTGLYFGHVLVLGTLLLRGFTVPQGLPGCALGCVILNININTDSATMRRGVDTKLLVASSSSNNNNNVGALHHTVTIV